MKTLINLAIILFLLHVSGQPVYAYNLRKINNREHLSSSTITSLYQDQRGLMWIGTGSGLNTYDGRNVAVYQAADNSKNLTGNQIVDMLGTDDHVLWIHTYYGLNRIDRNTNTLETFDMFNRVSFSAKDSRGNVFLIQGNNSLYYLLKGEKQFDQLYMPDLIAADMLGFFIDGNDLIWIVRSNGHNLCYSIQINDQGNLMLKQEKGYQHKSSLLYCFHDENNIFFYIDADYRLYEFNTSTRQGKFIADLDSLLGNNSMVSSLVKFHDEYFVGLKTDGLSVLRKHENGYFIEKIPALGGIRCLLKDNHQDIVWIGTEGQGVYTYSVNQYSIKSTLLNDFTLNIRQPVSALFVDKDNTLWIGSKGDGILKIYDYNAKSNILECVSEHLTAANTPLRDNFIHSFSKSRQGNLWIGSEEGLSYYLNTDREIRRIAFTDGSAAIKHISAVYEQDSILWVTSRGMGIIKASIQWIAGSPSLKVMERFAVKEDDAFTNNFSGIYPENDQTIWFTNKSEGAFKINTGTSKIERVNFEESTLNEVNTIAKSRQNTYLIGTNFGFVKYNAGNYTVLSETNTFPNHVIHGILQESYAVYWLSTNRGIVYYNSDQEAFRTYDHLDGIAVVEFSDGAYFRDEQNGTLFFGGINGFVTINRNFYDEAQDYMPPIYFNHLTIFGKEYPIQEFLSGRGGSSVLELAHDQNFFSISFDAIDHLNGNNHVYYYKFNGINNQWIKSENANAISFTNLNPGEYQLLVKYYNRVLGKESYIYGINVKILPPWYQSAWAYFVYVLLTIGSVLSVVGVLIVRSRKRKADMLQKLEQQHKEKIYESKLQFFTNIAHEFCTPLTLIYGPCSRILSQNNANSGVSKYAAVIQQNAERLNALIRDLIDFNRIESGYKKPRITRLYLSEIVNKITKSFSDLAESQNIKFDKDIPPAISWNSDKDFIITIITNLLSNAFKYATHDKEVSIKVSTIGNELCLKISNTGKGIKEKDIPRVFDRYSILHDFEYQDKSTLWPRNGLGLAISYNMINLLEGTIAVESIPDEWTHFEVRLPCLKVDQEEKITYPAPLMSTFKPEPHVITGFPAYKFDGSKPTMMVIDDDPEIRWFIGDLFAADFNIIPAGNGMDAMDMLEDVHPDIIICDVVMQGVDGIELTKKLKLNGKTAHIPLILLSAKHTIEEKIAGIDAGAEIYITKPFHVAYLKSAVKQLMDRKETLKDYFASPLSAFELVSGKLTHREHKKFIKDILHIINKNLLNKDLTANFIAAKMNMSMRSLYRQVEAISDIDITDMIQECRLNRAADLLVKSKLTIDEIVFRSGFTNRSSFYRVFAKKYGCTPTAYRKDTLRMEAY